MSDASQTTTSQQLIQVGHSPDADDAFMFYAIAKKAIDLRGFTFQDVVEDIESLNKRSLKQELEVTAISLHTYAYVSDAYAIMTPGASFGHRYGPVVVSKTPLSADRLAGKKIAVPGEMTTAFLLLKIFEPNVEHEVVPFQEILQYVEDGRADAGLVIHEGQITYHEWNLQKVIDLGEWWHEQTGLSTPLGLDVIRKDLEPENQRKIARVLHDSISYALEHREGALEYSLPFARGTTKEQADRFVEMYVNKTTLDMDAPAREAITRLLELGHERKLLTKLVKPEFVEPI